MSVTLIIILVLIVLFLAVLIFAIYERKQSKDLKLQLKLKSESYRHLQEEFELYRKSENFKYQKQEEANEKIDNLHTGKLSADDILPKR